MKTSLFFAAAFAFAAPVLTLAAPAHAQCTEGCTYAFVWDNDRGRQLCDPDAPPCTLVGTEEVLVQQLSAHGYVVTVNDTLPPDLSLYSTVWITLGWRESEDSAGQITADEDTTLHEYLTCCSYHSIFLQGNDFARDHPTSLLLADFGAAFDGDGDPQATGNLQDVKGITGTYTAGMIFPYEYQQGPDNYPDNIIPGGPTPGFVVMDDPRGMGFPTESGFPPEAPSSEGNPRPMQCCRGASVFLSVILSAFQDGDFPSTKANFVDRTLQFFQLEPNASPAFIAPTPAPGATFTVPAGTTLEIDLAASDADGDFVTITSNSLPPNAILADVVPGPTGTATFTWLPFPSQVGTYTVSFEATDGISSDFTYVVITVEEGSLVAKLDIRPGGCPNPFNVGANGLLPVALVGTTTFNVHMVNLSTLSLEGAVPSKMNAQDVATPATGTEECACEESGADGTDDLMMKFKVQEIVDALGGTPSFTDGEFQEVTLSGELMDGSPFEATDCIRVQKNKKLSGPEIGTDRVSFGPLEPTGAAVRRFAFGLPAAGEVTITAYDVRGRVVDHILTGQQGAGQHVVEWNPWRLATGTYFVRFTAPGAAHVERVTIAR